MRFWVGLCVFLLGCSNVLAGEIKAIVNDYPISSFDVESRAKLMLLQRNESDRAVSETLKKQALADLIDERIKIQEAERQGVVPSNEDIHQAMKRLEEQNGLLTGAFNQMLSERKIPLETFENQILADLGWLRVLHKSGHTASVSDAEVQAREKMIRQELAQESFRFAEIIVPTEEKALSIWQKLQEGADFKELASAESISDSRNSGGLVSNADSMYYGEDVAPVLKQMRSGQLSRPIAVSNGYALVLMLDKRDALTSDAVTIWEMAQAVVPPDSIAATLLEKPIVGGCDVFQEVVKDDAIPQSLQRGQVSPNQLPAEVYGLLSEAPFKTLVGPVQTPDGLLYFMKCSSEKRRIVPTHEELARQIEMEKMDLESKQKLLEIKRNTVIEYR